MPTQKKKAKTIGNNRKTSTTSLTTGNKRKPSNTSPTTEQTSGKFPIVALGASAGGLEAFEDFFTHITNTMNAAFIIITHLDREHFSMLPEIINKYTTMPVFSIKNKMKVEINCIYVIPPRKNVSIEGGVLTLTKQDEPHYTNLPINYFLKKLSEDRGEKAIAIIASGAGMDGSLGLRDIKQNGGITFAQEPTAAAYQSMPQSAINSGCVDYVLKMNEMPSFIIQALQKTNLNHAKNESELQQIYIMLRTKTGHDFSLYKENTMYRRIERQMFNNNILNFTDYIRFLRLNPQELETLFYDLLIGVTRFFRDTEAFLILKKYLLIYLANKPSDYNIRIWVPACATGEETYSIAILLHECMEEIQRQFNVQIFGTDVNENSLETARAGIYSDLVTTDVSPERLKRFFIKEKNTYKIKKEIREMIIFGVQNLIKNPPFTKIDLISCRNLLIYLNNEAQKKIIPAFHYSLKSDGILFLGVSESISGYGDLFDLSEKKWKIFIRKDVTTPNAVLKKPLHAPIDIFAENTLALLPDLTHTIELIKTYLLKLNAAPCIVANRKGDILFTNGIWVDELLKVKGKNKTTLNISDISQTEIKNALLPSFHRAINKNTEVNYPNLKIKFHKTTLSFGIKIHHLSLPNLDNLYLINFEDEKLKKTDLALLKAVPKSHKKMLQMEQELKFTKENLQTTIEELESSNEELQSTNEELQSINEELETSREELQSLNEELIIVNTELQTRIDQIAAVNDDMNNVFNSTEIAALFLNNELKIKAFTPKAQDIIHLINTDIGRSISHFATTIKYEDMVEHANEVLNTLTPKTIEVSSKEGRWYCVKILPYRTLTNVIDGVVVVFNDITENKLAEEKLQVINDKLLSNTIYLENILDTIHEPLLVLTSQLKIISANRAFLNTFHLKSENTINYSYLDICNKQLDLPKLRELFDLVLTKNIVLEGTKFTFNLPDIEHKTFLLNARKVIHQALGEELILLAMEPA